MTLDGDIMAGLKSDLSSPDSRTRREAVAILAKMGRSAEVLDVLRSLATTDPDATVRYQAHKQLNALKATTGISVPRSAELREVEEAQQLERESVARWLRSADVGVRLAAVLRVSSAQRKDLLSELVRHLDAREDPWVLSAMVRAIGLLGSQKQIAVLQPFLSHQVARVAANAVEAIAAIGEELAFPMLLPLLRHDDHRVRANAVQALFKFDRDRAIRALADMAASEEERLRDSAIYLLGGLEDPEVAFLLRYRVEQEPVLELAEKACAALVARGEEDDLGLLVYLREKAEADRQAMYNRYIDELKARLGMADEDIAAIYKRHRASRVVPATAAQPASRRRQKGLRPLGRAVVERINQTGPMRVIRGDLGEAAKRRLLAAGGAAALAIVTLVLWSLLGTPETPPVEQAAGPAAGARAGGSAGAGGGGAAVGQDSAAGPGPEAGTGPEAEAGLRARQGAAENERPPGQQPGKDKPAQSPPADDAPPWERNRRAPSRWPPADWK